MTVNSLPPIIVGIVTFNSERVIERTIEAVLAQDHPPIRVFIADNASEDRTREIVAERFPEVEILPVAENRGPNPARNRIVERAGDDLVLLLDDDCIPTPGCLRQLAEAAVGRPSGAAFGARVVFDQEPERIQFDGALVHFVGEAVQRNSNRLVSEVDDATRAVGALGGGCQLIRGTCWRAVGGFDKDLFFGREDGEFSQRLAIAGYRSYIVPRAVVRHAVEPRGMRAGFYQIRNRWLVMLSLYRLRTLLLIAPALVVHELIILLFMIKQGNLGIYGSANLAAVRCLPNIIAKRRRVAAFRRVRDSAFLAVGPIAVREDLMKPGGWQQWLKNALDAFYAGYWRLVRPFV